MSLLYEFPADAAGMLVLTFCDHANDRFVDLAAWRFDTAAEIEAAWRSVPVAADDTAFLLDRHGPDGCTDNRSVDAAWIERRTGRPIATLIADGRRNLQHWLDDWAAARKAGGSRPRSAVGIVSGQ